MPGLNDSIQHIMRNVCITRGFQLLTTTTDYAALGTEPSNYINAQSYVWYMSAAVLHLAKYSTLSCMDSVPEKQNSYVYITKHATAIQSQHQSPVTRLEAPCV